MRVVLAVHTAELRVAACAAAGALRAEGIAEVLVVDLSSPVHGSTPQADADGVLHLPADPTLPMVASTALAQSARLAEWLGTCAPDVTVLAADAGLAHFPVMQRAQGLVPATSCIGCLLTQSAELETVGTDRWLTEPALLERAATTGAAISAADLLLCAPGVTTVALEQRGWTPPAGTRREVVLDAATLADAVRALSRDVPAAAAPITLPRISVCVTHHERPALLRQALASIAAQDYPNTEVLIVDDGSTSAETRAALHAMEPWMEKRGWHLLREPNRYLGGARNAAWTRATGEYVLFLDDDDCLRPGALRLLAEAAERTGADVTSCFLDYFEGTDAPGPTTPVHHRWVVPGPCGASAMLQNDFGAAAALVRRSLLEATGGYTEDRGVGFEDWEFWLRAYARGARFTVVPRALLWIRWNIGGMQQTTARRQATNHARALRPVAETMPAVWRDLPALAVGLHRKTQWLSHRVVQLERALADAQRAPRSGAVPAGTPSLPARVARGTSGPMRCQVWHTEGLGLSGILSWMWRLRTQFGPATDVDVRLVDLAMRPYGFQQAGPDPSTLYDERITSSAAFLEFLQRTADDVHVINHAFDVVSALVEQLGVEVVRTFRLIGVCHTDQDYYYDNLLRLAPVLRAIVCVSETCARELAARAPAHAAKLVVLPAWAVTLPAEPVPPRRAGAPLRLLYTGRIVQYQKRVLDLVRLAIELRRARVDATITIVGDGPDLPALQEALTRVRGHAVPVRVEPVRAPWDMEPLLRAHDALVQVSEFEGASVSLMEALAHGLLPVVTTTRSGHDLLVPGENAVTAPVGDMRRLAEALRDVTRTPAGLASLQRAARATAERYLGDLAYPERFAGLVSQVAHEPVTGLARVA
ncbi:MAG: glycosyltransferase [Gemmatimonas sp.]|jgi:glycosyltransferase involved in cell wall biosynthesis/GT2 family glycosyltransferase|uniref:glycosyltransferase n=1 Tax=Gemmatimonas sp. TaxID=1962908 RepID=UPI00391F0882|nr:glycosyltransferase [Gemmatimonadota bacterium]